MSRRRITAASLLAALTFVAMPGAAQAGSPGAHAPDAGALPKLDPKSFIPPTKRFVWDAPKVISQIDVRALFETNGIPNRFHVALLGVPWEEAYDFFLRSFTEQGLWVDPPAKQLQLDGQVALTGFDGNAETSYTVILQPYPSGHTGVIMGEAYFKDRTFAPGTTFAPVMGGAEGLITQNLESGLAMSYRVRATPEAILQFYGGALEQAGYTRASAGMYVRGTEALQVAISPGADGWAGVALVRLSLPGPTPEAPWKAGGSN